MLWSYVSVTFPHVCFFMFTWNLYLLLLLEHHCICLLETSMDLLHPSPGCTSVKLYKHCCAELWEIRCYKKKFRFKCDCTKTSKQCSTCRVCMWCLLVCVHWWLWTLSFLFLAGSEHQQLLVVKLLLVALPERSGRGKRTENLCVTSLWHGMWGDRWECQ